MDLKAAATKVSDFANKIGDDGKKAVAEVLHMATNFFAMSTNEPIWKIDEDEAKRVADPLAEILAEWGIRFDGVASPYARLIAAGVTVYGFRAVAVAAKRKAQRAEKAKAAQAAPQPDFGMSGDLKIQMPNFDQVN